MPVTCDYPKYPVPEVLTSSRWGTYFLEDSDEGTSVMTASVKKSAAAGRQEFSERLLKGSVKKSYAPIVDIDWDAPLDPDKFFLPAKTVSLYGTPLWETMTRAQQIELSRQELVNTLSAGIWFENILNQALLRKMMHQDPTASATHYELTELGDETRHMVMFGKAIERVGAKPMRPKRYQRMIINALPFAFQGSVLWVAALIGEEIFDSLQRQMMDDDELQPMVQRLMRIHVTEEARHIQFARDGLRKRAPHMRRISRIWVANLNGVGGLFFRYLFTNKVPYRRVGLDAREARRVARNSPHRHEVQIAGFAPLAAFLEEVGLMGPIARRLWKRSHFL
jgi:para-aminobenzoate N-oxygenase AurF